MGVKAKKAGAQKPMELDLAELADLKAELAKVRCWVTGYHAGLGRGINGNLVVGIPGEDSLRKAQVLIQRMINHANAE